MFNKKYYVVSIALISVMLFTLIGAGTNAFAADLEKTHKSMSEETDDLQNQVGWTQNGNEWNYISDDKVVYKNGLFDISGKKYLFNKDGNLQTGFQRYSGRVYYFSETGGTPDKGLGTLLKYRGFKKLSSNIYYFDNNYSVATGWKKIAEKIFYFNKTGKLQTGWLTLGSKKYYLKPSGKLSDKGSLYTGLKKIRKKTYYFKPKGKLGTKGKMLKGIKKIGKYRYCFNASGVLQKKGIVGTKKTGYYYADKRGKISSKTRKALVFKGKKWNVLNGKASRAKTTKQVTLFRALKLVEKVTKFKGKKSKQLKTCFNYMKNAYVEMNPRIPHFHGRGWTELYANDMFVNGKGNCFSYSTAFAYVAKAIGYKNVYCCNSGGHGWAEINGLIYDPEWSRHHSDNSFYALSYNTKTSNGYKGAISAGYSWMHVKI